MLLSTGRLIPINVNDFTARPVDWTSTLAGDTQITTIACSIGTLAGAVSVVTGIQINGNLLFDYNNIGVDDSGNDNHFHDQNFAVGNTDEVWSATLTGSGAGGTLNNQQKAFDGYLDTFAAMTGATGTVTITWDASSYNFTNVTQLRAHIYSGDSTNYAN